MSEAPCKTLLVLLAILLASSEGHILQWTPNSLAQVQGLYVKPSFDGATGDLYVAATEDEGKKTQWVADQPINFLGSAAQQVAPASVAYSTSVGAPVNGIVTSHQQAVYTSPTTKYYYSPDSNAVAPCPHAQANPVDAAAVQYPMDYYRAQYAMLQYFYPYILQTAALTAANALKEAGLSDEMTQAVMSRTSLWSPYSYPTQYANGAVQNSWPQQKQVTAVPATRDAPKEAETESDEAS